MTYWQRYVRTFNGRVVEMYHKMESRVKRGDTFAPKVYKGKFLIGRKRFKKLAFSSRKLKRLFNVWKDSGFDPKKVPTVDRIDSTKGYQRENIRFLSLEDNQKRKKVKRNVKRKSKRS